MRRGCSFETSPARARELVGAARVFIDESVCIKGLRIYGSPWQPRFYDWAFNLDRGEPLREKWARIPDDTDILVTHGPPYGILDRTSDGEHAGDEELRPVVDRIQPRLHAFGHIHPSYGEWRRDRTTFVNAAVCDESMGLANEPVVVDV